LCILYFSKPSRIQIINYIAGEAKKPFVWGETDCCSFVNTYVDTFFNISPLDVYGRKHSNEKEARAWLSERGGIVKAVCRVMKSAGFCKTQKPKIGDIGLIRLTDSMVAMALFDGTFWHTRHETGLIGIKAEKTNILRAWQCHK